MDELKFVGKCFFLAALILVLSQIKTKEGTIETAIQSSLTSSETAHLVNKVASGGAKAVKALGSFIKEKINSTSASTPSPSQVEEKIQTAKVSTQEAVDKIEQKVKAEIKDLDALEIEEIEELE